MLIDDELVTRAQHLADRANLVLADLDLLSRLAPFGRPIRIGSSASGVMVVPDIDIGVFCPVLDTARIFTIAQSLFDHPRVKRTNLIDERGAFQSMPGPEDEGIYCGVRYFEDGTLSGCEWKLDVWFFPEEAPRPEIAMRDRILAASADERLAILRLKHALLDVGRYGKDVHAIDVYRAVLDHGVRSLAQFQSP